MAWAACTEWASGDVITEAKMDAQSTAIEELQGILLSTTAIIDPDSLTPGTTYESSGITVTGAAANDAVIACPPAAIAAGLSWCAYVSAPDTVKVRVMNCTAGTIDGASGTWGIRVIKANP